MTKNTISLIDLEDNAFNEELMTFQDEDNFDPNIEFKPKKLKMKYKFYIAS